MNKYDFMTVPVRERNSIKWGNLRPGELPMWIADMDFATAPEILAAMRRKLETGAFGYEDLPSEYFQAVADWQEKQHGVRPKEEWEIYVTGVVPAISSIVRRIAHLGDQVLVQEPVYNIFYNSIENNGRRVLSSDLQYDVDKQEYRVDWTDLEKKLADPLTTLMIFCNPHNPIGYVWTKEEVQRIADLCHQHHVVLVSDEIHGDLVREGRDMTPAFSVTGPARSSVISLTSPSKTFNVAALHAATAIIPDENLRAIVNRGFNSEELAEPNILSVPATIAAYEEGGEWLKQLKGQLQENFTYAESFIKDELPSIKVIKGTATYLLWVDISQVASDASRLVGHLRAATGLIVSAGNIYRGQGSSFIRINLACPLASVKDGLDRLKRGVASYQE
ncbi:MalY/PatB family protein [Lactobacillus sp.]|uniref:MalY/PatB family protein n=1 Tax=Lactobacillus sp. TaxID=1591 RepID=UPI003EF999A8